MDAVSGALFDAARFDSALFLWVSDACLLQPLSLCSTTLKMETTAPVQKKRRFATSSAKPSVKATFNARSKAIAKARTLPLPAPVPKSPWEIVRTTGTHPRQDLSERTTLIHGDAANWIGALADNSIHAVVTDPPYGVIEYNGCNQEKLRAGRGGVWRIPPSFDGSVRSPVPRFTVLTGGDLTNLAEFFAELGKGLLRVLVPGGHLMIASNPLLSSMAFTALQQAGFEKRGEVIRLVQTLRGGDRPKNAHDEFPDVSVMARSCWEPWGIFRKPCEGTVAANLRKWGTGGLRRISDTEPFRDVIECSPTRPTEKKLAPHPSLKPQRFMRQIVRASLPLGKGIVYDPFAGSGSTLAAAEALGYTAIGTERDADYFAVASGSFPALVKFKI